MKKDEERIKAQRGKLIGLSSVAESETNPRFLFSSVNFSEVGYSPVQAHSRAKTELCRGSCPLARDKGKC